jgi:hypothetical protein
MENRLVTFIKKLLKKQPKEVKPKCYSRTISRELKLGGNGK